MAENTPPLATLLTDFGTADYYVAAVKGVILSRVPSAVVVDITHQISQGDIATAAFLLHAAAPAFPPGTVHLAVVDPGVGSDRRILVAEKNRQIFVAPDNGLLTYILVGGGLEDGTLDRCRVRSIERSDLYREAPGETFHGRDRFAPITAALLAGERPEKLGLLIDDPILLDYEPPRQTDGELLGQVIHIDQYGNAVTNIPADWLDAETFRATIGDHHTERRASHYAALAPGEAAAITGSLGTLELSIPNDSLAAAWGVERHAIVRVQLG